MSINFSLRSSSVESLNSQRSFGHSNRTQKNPLRLSNDKAQPAVRTSNLKSLKEKGGGGGGGGGGGRGDVCAKRKSSGGAEKENVASSAADCSVGDETLQGSMNADVTNDASLPVDPDNEMAEIDARLNALQNFMKTMGHD